MTHVTNFEYDSIKKGRELPPYVIHVDVDSMERNKIQLSVNFEKDWLVLCVTFFVKCRE